MASAHRLENPPVFDRADRLIAHLRALDGNVVLIAHSHFGRVLGVRWIGLPVIEAQHFRLSTASLNVLGYEHGRTDQVLPGSNVARLESAWVERPIARLPGVRHGVA